MSNKNLYVTSSSRIVEKIDDIEPKIVLNKMLREGIDYTASINISDQIITGFTATTNGAIAVSGLQKEYKTLVPQMLYSLIITKNNERVTQVAVTTDCLDVEDGVSHFVSFIEAGMTIKLKQTYFTLPAEMVRTFKFAPFKSDYDLRNNPT